VPSDITKSSAIPDELLFGAQLLQLTLTACIFLGSVAKITISANLVTK
jgi:hypothetical protein